MLVAIMVDKIQNSHQRQKRCNGIDIVHHSNIEFYSQLMSDLILSKN